MTLILTAARAHISGTDTTGFGSRDAGFYILNNAGEVLGTATQDTTDLSGADRVYIGASLHGTNDKMLSALGGHDIYEILPEFTAGAAASQSTTHVTINDLSGPNTYHLASVRRH